MPSTESATITIVANTGWLIATRVIHMGLARRRGGGSERLYDLGAAEALDARRQAVLQVVELRGEHVVRSLYPRQNLDQVRAVVARPGGDRPALEPVADDEPYVGLHAVAAHRRDGQRGGVALRIHRQAHAGEHAGLHERSLVHERHVDVDR